MDNKIELELALRDSASVTLRTIAANLDSINKKMGGRGEEEVKKGGDEIEKTAKRIKEFGESAKQAGGFFSSLGNVLITFSRFLSGPVGAAAVVTAGAVATAKILKSYADATLSLRALAIDTGLSEDKLSVLMRGQAILGIDPKEAVKNLETIGGKMKEMSTQKGGGSQLYRDYAAMGQVKFAEELEGLLKANDWTKAWDRILEHHAEMKEKYGDRAAELDAKALGVKRSFLEGIRAATVGVAPAYRMNAEAAKSWSDRYLIIQQNITNQWNATIGSAIWALNRFDEINASIPSFQPGQEGELDVVTGPITKPVGPTGATTQTPQTGKDLKDSKKESGGYLDDISAILQRMWEKGKSIVGRQSGGSVLPGRTYLVGEGGPEMFSSDGRSQVVGASGPELLRSKTAGFMFPDMEPEPEVPGLAGTVPYFRPPRNISKFAGSRWERFPEAKADIIDMRGGEFLQLPSSWAAGRMRSMRPDPTAPLALQAGAGDIDTIPRSKPPRSQNAVTMDDDEGSIRSRIDGALSDSYGSGGGRMDAEIFFKNVPPGVKTDADGNGFDNFTVGKTRQLEGM